MGPWVKFAVALIAFLVAAVKFRETYAKNNNNQKDIFLLGIALAAYVIYAFVVFGILREHYMAVVVPVSLFTIASIVIYWLFDRGELVEKGSSKMKVFGTLTAFLVLVSLTTAISAFWSAYSSS